MRRVGGIAVMQWFWTKCIHQMDKGPQHTHTSTPTRTLAHRYPHIRGERSSGSVEFDLPGMGDGDGVVMDNEEDNGIGGVSTRKFFDHA